MYQRHRVLEYAVTSDERSSESGHLHHDKQDGSDRLLGFETKLVCRSMALFAYHAGAVRCEQVILS